LKLGLKRVDGTLIPVASVDESDERGSPIDSLQSLE